MATNCQPIRDQIGDLESEIADLQALLPNATPSEKADIIRQIREDQSAIRGLHQQLGNCVDTVQIQAILVSDDDGSNRVSAGSTVPEVADQIKQWVARANSIFTRVRLQFQFEGNDDDVLSIRSTLINNLGGGGPSAPDRMNAARATASFFPSRVVVFFRSVTILTPPVACGPGCGFSASVLNFIAMPGFNDTTVCGHQNIDLFAHEAGHYFGLEHTFTENSATGKTFATIAEAEKFFNDNGREPSVFDGDQLTDTPPDPFIDELQCETSPGEPANVMLSGIEFGLLRNNIMSYYDGSTKTLSAAQAARVRRTLLDRATTGLSLVPRPVQSDLKDTHGSAID